MMNEVIQALEERRSIRKYKKEHVSQEVMDQIIEAGLYAANGKGLQNTILIQVSKDEVRNEVAEQNRLVGGWKEGFDPFYGAPDMIIVLAKKDYPNGKYDGALVMGNLMNGAHALGVGSCWINRAYEEFESEWGKNFLKSLGIEEEYEGVGHCALGYIDQEYPKKPAIKEKRVYYVK